MYTKKELLVAPNAGGNGRTVLGGQVIVRVITSTNRTRTSPAHFAKTEEEEALKGETGD